MKKFAFKVFLILFSLASCIIITEIVLRIFLPVEYIIPASDFIPEYGVIAYPEQKIVHSKPGEFHYVYTTNSKRYRGKLISTTTPGEKVFLLGDSNVFGFGVQDDETISHNMNMLSEGKYIAINFGNGGWSLPQEVRRYIELGRELKPSTLVLHMAANDLIDNTYGINWVSIADSTGNILLRDVPINPAGRLRKLMPPDSFFYRVIFSSQLMCRIKYFLNKYSMKFSNNNKINHNVSSGINKINSSNSNKFKIPFDRVTIMDLMENERRYASLLEAFAKLLKKDNVRFIFLTDSKDFHQSNIVKRKVNQLSNENLIEHYAVDNWFKTGVDYPESPQGHQWGREATEALAKHLHELLGK